MAGSGKSSRKAWAEFLQGKGKATGGSLSAVPLPVRTQFSGTVLGVDPSLRGTGLAVVVFEEGKVVGLKESLTVKVKPSVSVVGCLDQIAGEIQRLAEKHRPCTGALETPIYAQNQQTALRMGAVWGVVSLQLHDLFPSFGEYAPLRVKQALSGRGRADKRQVGYMVQQLLGLAEPLAVDESDAAAVAICHAWTCRGN